VAIAWAEFDNTAGSQRPLPDATAQVPARTSGFTVATLTSKAKPSQRVQVFVRHSAGGPQVVGLERFW
jgi:hypothetical protein